MVEAAQDDVNTLTICRRTAAAWPPHSTTARVRQSTLMSPVYRPSQFRRIALRSTGGKVKAIFWHLGVRCALEERGFVFTSGFGPRSDPVPGEIGLLIGSSAGSVFSLLVAAGYDVPT